MDTITIGEAFPNLSIGGTPARGDARFYNGKYLWVSIKDMNGKKEVIDTSEKITKEGVDNSNCKLVKKGSLLFSFKLTVGRVAFAGSDLYTNEAIAAFDPDDAANSGIDLEFLAYILPSLALEDSTKNVMGAAMLNKEKINNIVIPRPNPEIQQRIARGLKKKLAEVDSAVNSIQNSLSELIALANSIIRQSIEKNNTTLCGLSESLIEVKKGIGEDWRQYPVLGATRAGLAPAKEPPGKSPQKYKPVFPGTVFYNPMRILIGSIAYVDEDDEPGITSPDYVALKGKEGVVDSRWFYYWLRSPYGQQCISSLARGAVRERMLFNRLKEGSINLPEYKVQLEASKKLKEIKAIKLNLEKQLKEIELLPARILEKEFGKYNGQESK
jgi:type I restriction enzyme S subunit